MKYIEVMNIIDQVANGGQHLYSMDLTSEELDEIIELLWEVVEHHCDTSEQETFLRSADVYARMQFKYEKYWELVFELGDEDDSPWLDSMFESMAVEVEELFWWVKANGPVGKF